jgi:hypothetical protein
MATKTWHKKYSIVTPTPFEPLKIWRWLRLPQIWKLYDQLETYIYNSTKFHEILSSSSLIIFYGVLCDVSAYSVTVSFCRSNSI